MGHDHHRTCSTHEPTNRQTPGRHGSRLEHGNAHARDHERWSRRDFMVRLGLASLGTAFYCGRHPVTVFGGSPLLHALQGSDTDRILILIQLSGGNDGLNTVVPVNNDIYYQHRPTIAIPKSSAVLLDDETGLHPAMGALESLWGDGHMSVVHNVGYQNQTRSHFEGTVNWSTARNQGTNESTGWLGRYLLEGNPDIISTPTDYPLAVRVGGPATLFQSAAGNLGVTFGDAQEFEQFVLQGGFYDTENVPATLYGEELAFVRNVTNASFRYVQSVQTASDNGSNLVSYPDSSLARSLAVVARMLRGGLRTGLYTVSRGGFDTHSNQGGPNGNHGNNLGDVANSVTSFLSDLRQDGLDSRVMVMTFSEFGRTLSENGSRGTDHGAGAPMLMFGTGLAGGLYGTQSNLLDLYGGDPRFTTDYRSVYATVLQDWFGLSDTTVDGILNGSFARLGFVEDALQVGFDQNTAPGHFVLDQNYPNPFDSWTTIAFALNRAGHVRLDVFDINGRKVDTLIDGHRGAGSHEVVFESTTLASGVYLYRLNTEEKSDSRTMNVVK